MSWDGLYVKDRIYPKFEIGEEVYCVKGYKALTKRQGYVVLDIKSRFKNIKGQHGWVITLLNDIGFECEYSTYRFKKTDRQLRQDKLNNLLSYSID